MCIFPTLRRMRCRSMDAAAFIAAALLTTSLSFASLGDDVLRVDDDAPPGGDGLSWDTPLRFLQDALTLAAAGGVAEIRVAQGMYQPDRDTAHPAGSGDRDASFVVNDGLALRGGYAGIGEPDPGARDVEIYESILSGDLLGNDGPDFTNYEDNSQSVVRIEMKAAVELDGLSIVSGYAIGGEGIGRGSGLLMHEGVLTLRACRFSRNLCESSFDGDGGALNVDGAQTVYLDHCCFDDNRSSSHAGGAFLQYCETIVIEGCEFRNHVAQVSSAVEIELASLIEISHSTFVDNTASVGIGAVAVESADRVVIEDTTFQENKSLFSAIGAVSLLGVDDIQLLNCLFAGNESGDRAGAIGIAGGTVEMVNCVFSRNTAPTAGGAIYVAYSPIRLANCSFSRNASDAVGLEIVEDPVFTNCIFWENGTKPIVGGSGIQVSYSDIQGGWPGEGNIDADPLFVQAGTDDLRLSFGSPCIDAGNNDAVPPEVETDLEGDPRIQGGIVDMGAYEGEHEGGLPAAAAHDVDQGEFVFLIPDGVELDPLTTPVVMFRNVSGPDDASVLVTQIDGAIHEDAEGFRELGSVLRLETTLAEGEYLVTIYLPFDLDDVGDLELSDMEVTSFAESVGNWSLAVALNTVDSPGHPRRIGDRILRLDGGAWGTTLDVGDWGVFWDPSLQRGFTWGNVDYPGDFGFGAALCPPDAHQPPDGSAGLTDLLIIIHAWGEGMGPFDVNRDGTVDIGDLIAVLDAWGPCR